MSSVKDDNVSTSKEGKAKLSVGEMITRVKKNISIEPLVICWLLPFLISYASVENLNLEKACRGFVDDRSTGFNKDICKLFVRKDSFNIICGNSTMLNSISQLEIQKKYPEVYDSIKDKLGEAVDFLCKTEDKVQQKLSTINAIRNPISAVGPLIIILFAGPWSDKKNLRVPCMIVPFLGEAIGFFTVFLSAIFINGPVEFPAYAYRLIPSLTGAESLMVMAIFSYLSASSTEEDRTFRFGMFQILMTIVPIIAQSLSPTFNDNFEYTQLFGMLIPVHIIGLIYAIFYLKEVKSAVSKEDAAYDNPAMQIENTNRNDESALQINEPAVKETRNACLEFFDPRLANQCLKSLIKRRNYGVRSIIILLMLMHLIGIGVSQGESQNIFFYQRLQLRWDIDTNTYHNVFSIVMGLVGTLLMIGLLSKLWKVSDISLTLISTALTVISKFIYSIVRTTAGFFFGTAVDFTSSVKFLGVRSIISKLVPSEDLSTMFAIMGVTEALAGLIFSYIYPTVYQYLLTDKSRDVSEMFYLSAAFFLISFITYLLVQKLLKTKEQEENEDTKKGSSTKL